MNIVTHNGNFHADDVSAYAVLQLLYPDARLIRTRDPLAINSADIVFDVGMVYEQHLRRYDHHQKDGPKRATGEPLSSAGLIWIDYGLDFIDKVLGRSPYRKKIWDTIYNNYILYIDLNDNGIKEATEFEIVSIIAHMNNMPVAGNFELASQMVQAYLIGFIRNKEAELIDDDAVLAAHNAATDKRWLKFDRLVKFHAIWEYNLPTLYMVCQTGTQWRLYAVAVEEWKFETRKPLPSEWGGLMDNAFEQASGVPDVKFCHNKRFLAVANTEEAIMKLLDIALDNLEVA